MSPALLHLNHYHRHLPVFDMVDEDGSGLIDQEEMTRLLNSLGKILSQEEIDKGFAKLDKDSSGSIDFDEFYTWYKEVQESKNSSS
mmetsp:Transcript_5444/g.9914  ORF Transcript_5444/g.9914 Transcript_5444/m.9914 type:complete len:86 (-) Transcript_5444:83-340(-)